MSDSAAPLISPVPVEPSLILTVEDDNDTRAIIRQALLAMNHHVLEAADGIEAQEVLKKQTPDAIVLDVMMPRMNGIEFVKWLRSEFKSPFIPVLMLTALGAVEDKVEGLTVGADEYLVKPFNYRELQARVQALLRIKKLTADLYRRSSELEAANTKLSEAQAALVIKERDLAAMQMAGAAAHNLGQPITTALLHCRLAEKACETLLGAASDTSGKSPAAQVQQAVKAIQHECETMRAGIAKLKTADASSVVDYVGKMQILDIDK